MKDCMIYGTGGHAKVLLELLELNHFTVRACYDDAIKGDFNDVPVTAYIKEAQPMLIGIGNNKVRMEIAERTGRSSFVCVHPAAIVSAKVKIEEGTVILSGAVVQTDVKIGRHCILNANSVVDHDVVINDFAHVGPNVYIGGGTVIGKGVNIGPGAVIMRNTVVADWEVIHPNAVIG